MPVVEVVENPRRRRRRPRMSALQRKYFGKRRSRPRRRRRTTVTRTVTTRRNPMLASIGNPRRRRRQYRTVRGYVVRRKRNPKLFGLAGFDLQTAAWVGVGMLGSNVVPGLVRKVWPGLPSSGPMLSVVKVGATFLTSIAVRMLTKSRHNANLVMAGGLALVLVDLFRQYVAPRIGLTALGSDSSPVYTEELRDIGRYVDTPSSTGVRGYVESPSGAY